MAKRALKTRPPFVVPLAFKKKPSKISVDLHDDRNDRRTLGAPGIGARVGTLPDAQEPGAVLVLPYAPGALRGFDRSTIRVFRFDPKLGFTPIWNSGINTEFNFVWAKIQRPGTYVAIGLPRDRVLQQALRELAYLRRTQDSEDRKAAHALTMRVLDPFVRAESEGELNEVRQLVARMETAMTGLPLGEIELGTGGHPDRFPFPHGDTVKAFRARLERLDVPVNGLPEELLFTPPEITPPGEVPWPSRPDDDLWKDIDREVEILIPRLRIDILELIKWFLSKDWPMYQHDVRHTGRASGLSSITSTTAGQLQQRFKKDLDGPINTKPSIAQGKIYVGTTKYGGNGGTLYKIDMCSGDIEGKFPTTGSAYYSISGIGGSPSVYKGKVYFTTVFGQVYCVDAATMTETAPHPPALWVTDLKTASAAKKQPVNNPSGDCWTSVLVVNDKVYVGSGEGEVASAWGFIWCLDANTGEVQWLFCTNKRQNINAPGTENSPNVIPRAAAVSDPLPAWATAAGFSLMDNPPETGSSPWSSFAYDSVLNRVYVGTGNSQYLPPAGLASTVLPDQRYGSGLIALDATTGAFQGFHVGGSDDSYHANDIDVDVPGAPTVFVRGGQRVVCYGSKNGSFYLLDANTMQVLGSGAQRRQLLARSSGSGHPGNRGTAISSVATSGGVQENKWGVLGTPAIHTGLGKIFVGLGGYEGARGGTTTPFIRALDWNNLNDAWPTALVGTVTKYTLAQPPVYVNDNEAALSSPAVVNDVVFVSTTDPANSRMRLYALDAATGLCLWSAPLITGGGWPNYALGPAISGEYVVAGAGNSVYIYTRPSTPWCFIWRWPFRWDLLRIALDRP